MVVVFAVLGTGLRVEEVVAGNEFEGLCVAQSVMRPINFDESGINHVPLQPYSRHLCWHPILRPGSPPVTYIVLSECHS